MTLLSFGTDWLYVLVPLAVFLAGAAFMWKTGASDERLPIRRAIGRIGSSLERTTGLPGWCAAALATGLVALVIAVQGFLWDVAWHIDLGRDQFLFTPAHTAILVGLGMIAVAGVVGIAFATVEEADTPWRLGWLHIPYSAAALVVLGGGAMLGFPLDELWHRSYGIDVTMWGPTHLVMVGGASFTPIALWLMVTEAGPAAGRAGYVRRVRILLAGAMLTGLSTFQAEFDFGVPQFQQLYHPVLIAIASGIALVAARSALGRGGALMAAAIFLLIRAALVWLVGPVLDLTVAVPALYLGSAGVVELVFVLRALPPLRRALLAGLGIGTVGLASEWAWTHLLGRHPWGAALWPEILVALAGAAGGAVVGLALGGVLSFRRPGLRALPLAGAGAALLASLVLPFPRHDAPITAEIQTDVVSDGRADVRVRLEPADAARDPDWFEVLAWQGGHSERHSLEPTGDGAFATRSPVPFGGDWKSILRLTREDVIVAAPVYMPEDREIGAPEVPLVPRRTVELERDTVWLMREAHDGPAWPAFVAYGTIAAIAIVWLSTLALAAIALSRRFGHGRLAGRRVLLTGAAGGIGRAATEALRRQGARVVGIDLVGGADVIAADLRDAGRAERAVEEAARRLGGIDVVVNNAGVGGAQDSGAPVSDATREMLDVNLFGAWRVTAAAIPHLLASRGHVVNVSSGLAIATAPYAAAYSASKRGLDAFGDVLRVEYRGRVSVTNVRPGYIRTNIHDAAAAEGASLEGAVWEDTLGHAADAIVRACADRPREVSTGVRTALGLRIARHLPRLAEAFILLRYRRVSRGRPAPTFVSVDERPRDRVDV